MKRIFATLLLLAFVPAISFAAPQFEEGTQYDPVQPPQPSQAAPGKVEVIEMFWYGCPHCFELEPLMRTWEQKKPDYIEFRRMPAVLGENWRLYAQAFYAAEALGVLDKIHEPLFSRIHKDKKPPRNEGELAEFFSQTAGVNADDFKKAFTSFGVLTKTARAAEMSKRYGIQGVPSFVIAGKYHTSASQAGGPERLFQVIEFLAAKEKPGDAAR